MNFTNTRKFIFNSLFHSELYLGGVNQGTGGGGEERQQGGGERRGEGGESLNIELFYCAFVSPDR